MEMCIALISSIASALSAVVAIFAVAKNRKTATQQAFFLQKAKAYDDFLKAFSAVVYDHANNSKRDALTSSFYSARLYAPEELIPKLSKLVNRAYTAETHRDFVALEPAIDELLQLLSGDLRAAWKKKVGGNGRAGL